MLKSPHHLNFYAAPRNGEFSLARGMEIMCFDRPLRTNKVIVSVHPGVIGCERHTVLIGDENTRRRENTRAIQHVETELSHGFQITFILGYKLTLRARQDLLSPQRSIPATIGDERDTLSIRRPARVDVVKFSV